VRAGWCLVGLVRGGARGGLAAGQTIEQAFDASAPENQRGYDGGEQRPHDDDAHGAAGDGTAHADEHVLCRSSQRSGG